MPISKTEGEFDQSLGPGNDGSIFKFIKSIGPNFDLIIHNLRSLNRFASRLFFSGATMKYLMNILGEFDTLDTI